METFRNIQATNMSLQSIRDKYLEYATMINTVSLATSQVNLLSPTSKSTFYLKGEHHLGNLEAILEPS